MHKLKTAWIKEYTTKDDGEQDSNSNQEKTAPNNSNPDQGNDPAAAPPGQPGSPSASSQLSSSSSSVTALHKFKKLNAFRISSNKVRSALIFTCGEATQVKSNQLVSKWPSLKGTFLRKSVGD